MLGVGLCLVAIRVLNVMVPRQLGLVVNSLGQPDKIRPFIELSIYAVLAASESSVGVRALRTYLWLPVENYAYQSIDCASYNHIMSLSSDFHDNKNSGELYQAMWQGHSVIQLLETLLYQLAPMLVDLLVACIFLYYLFDAYMLLIVSSTMVMYLWASVQFTVMQTKARRTYVATSRRSYQVLYDTMGGWRTVSYFNRLQHAKETYASSRAAHLDNRITMYLISCWTEGSQGLILDIGLFSACFYAIYQIVYRGLSVGQFITLFTYWANLAGEWRELMISAIMSTDIEIGPLDTLTSAHRQLLSLLVDAEQLLELFQTKPTVKDGFGHLKVSEGQVEFDKVHFSYDGKKPILENISFKAEPGKKIALVGESGGGKSTILKLLFRFYDVTKGSIMIDGQDIRSVTLESLRECIGVVPQDPSLFNDTIMSNLRYAKLNATDEEVIDACKAAAIHDKIVGFSKGYNSKVGEHGVKLSGGELQRIAIARAILKDPRIILLDEATSSVDSETEAKIQEALDKLSQGRTTFIVAHRLSTIEHADLVLVIKDGAILESGPPAELLQSKGKYYRLWVKQMGIRGLPKTSEFGSAETEDTVDGITRAVNPSSGDDKSSTETGKLTKDSKRPDIQKNPSGKEMGVFGALGKRMFRPNAPEFIPQYQRGTAASGSNDEGHQHASAAHKLGHDAANAGKSEKEKKQRSKKRKTRQDASGAAPHDSLNNGSKLDGSSDTPHPTDSTSKREAEPKPKRSRFDRRHQSRSEPAGQGLQRSQGDGTSEVDGSPMDSSEGRPMRNTSRRVTAPSDPPLGPPVVKNGGHSQHRRRQRHWRVRNPNVISTSGKSSGTQSSSTGRDWSSDSHSAGLPLAPFSTPAGGVTPKNEVTRGTPANGVRFAPVS
jgi:ABC-type transport system involved in Fe-S cluster assembly fused permease/ATPase subunit